MITFFTRSKWIGALLLLSVMSLQAQSKLSPLTQIIMNEKGSAVKSKSSIKTKGQPDMLSVFVKVQNESYFSLIEEYGGVVQTVAGNICTATVPLSAISALSQEPEVISISAAIEAKPTLDVARFSSNNTLVNSGQSPLLKGYTGKGVVMGVIDTGFDFTHPNFYSDASLSSYRIKYVWNQNAETGVKPQPYNYGAEYTTQSEILAAGTDNSNEDHGTHTSGIAGGSGYNTFYKGIAPGSDLYLVGTDMTNTGIMNGLSYIIDKSKQAGKPCVINLSLGSQIGPHDGTSDFDLMLTEKVGPGVIVVGAAGNEGGQPVHVRANGPAQLSTVAVPSDAPYFFSDIWGNVNQNYQVRVGIYNASTGAVIKQTPWVDANLNPANGYISYVLPSTQSTYLVQFGFSLDPNNNKYNVLTAIQGNPFVQSESIVISINPLNNKFVDMWASDATYSNALNGVSDLVAGNTDYTVGEVGGVAKDIITVGAYVSRDKWTAMNGGVYHYQNGFLNDIAGFSSKGPTADGRIKPDIAAPGSAVVSSVNHFSSEYSSTYPLSVAMKTVNSTNYYWGIMQGTSMASPVVAGSLALWLEADPTLTPQRVKDIFAATAKQNTLSRGAYPNNNWGYGALDSYAGIVKVLNTVDVPVSEADKSILVYPNPIVDNCNIQVSANNKIIRVELKDISGRNVFARVFSGGNNQESLSLASLPRGIYVINIQTDLGVKSEKVVLK
ncbi:MAG: S8/S53 family peptidase [Bacteroidales bacterium]